MNIRRARCARLLLGLGMVFSAAAIQAPAANADNPPNCEQVPWGFLGSLKREICDQPIRKDGSWTRRKVIGIPAHYRNPSSSCYSSGYWGTTDCTYYPGGQVPDRVDSDETYDLRADTVPTDEPGHMPDPAPAPPAPKEPTPAPAPPEPVSEDA
ncbi:CDGP domain-containing protein [Mycobacteroides franklinii]|nr:hypothetical protein [Mycobacteroides franklinii]